MTSLTLCLSDLRLTEIFSDLGEDIGYKVTSSLVFKVFVQDVNSQDKGPWLLFSYPCILCNIFHCNTVHSYGIFISAFVQKAQPRQKSIGSNRFSFFSHANFVLVWVFHWYFLNFFLEKHFSFKNIVTKTM